MSQEIGLKQGIDQFLDDTLLRFFIGNPRLDPFISKCRASKIYHVGSLVQHQEKFIFRKYPTSKSNQMLIIRLLDSANLRFGMAVTGWIEPSEPAGPLKIPNYRPLTPHEARLG